MYQRFLNLSNLLEMKSFFLFGPRATGKTTLIANSLQNAYVFDLLEADTYARLLKRSSIIDETVTDPTRVVVIDEIQKLPSLLDEVHRLIQKRRLKFLLTGCSARKLKRGAANLLAGRAWKAELFPLSFCEISEFNLERYLNRGGLPDAYLSEHYHEELASYASLYLREEIQAEAITRNVQAFAEFLDLIALSNGAEINFESLASDCQISTSTLKNYVQILEDTLIGFRLPAYTKTKKRKAISRSKFYLFDVGVVNSLCKRGEIVVGGELFGPAFEHFIILEMRTYLSYTRSPLQLNYWRSTSQFEVDLVIDKLCAIEIKSTKLVVDKHMKGLRAFKEDGLVKRYIMVSLDSDKRITADGIEIFPWKMFLTELWQGTLFLNLTSTV